MNRRVWTVAPLVFGSGACALVYQVAWTRDFRLVFGASTAASAAVVAIFAGGLGLGGWLLGRRVERHPSPLRFYATLEALVALGAAATPLLLALARRAYVALGGMPALGPVGATSARLALAALVILAPTFLMGGTLPAIACAVEEEDDPQRRGVAILYGVNTLGAVVGCVASTFLLLETLGTHLTLWLACTVNALIAVLARAMSRALPAPEKPAAQENDTTPPDAPARLVFVAAAVVGSAFFLMELVWYRMLGPLLGGTVFTFGAILAVALLGIGAGGALYTWLLAHRPARLRGFAYTCLAEALCIAAPFAIGDRLAVLALLLRPLGALGFGGYVAGWLAIAAIVVLPAAIVAGVQFPLLIALLGRGRHGVGREVGLVYAFNTGGAILGALAGGFGLMPLLSAPGCWRLVAGGLALFGAAVALLSGGKRAGRALLPAAVLATVTFALLAADGPTAAWRHAPIGAGRVPVGAIESPAAIAKFERDARRAVVWEAEGVESSVAMSDTTGLAFIVNGKVDGHARDDAATQVMAGLIGAALHPRPERAMVIGLGTGSTAGWLGKVATVDRVDVAELEPAIVEVARRCAAVNEDVLHNPKVHVLRGDAREILGVSRATYDLVFSEPSNPYRAGVASLYTQEFYRAVAARLGDGGIFSQWVQAYEVDGETIRTVMATLQSVFPFVEAWQAMQHDLILVASARPVVKDVGVLRGRLGQEPFARALRGAWRADDLEGFLGHYLARPSFVRALAEGATLSKDDRAVIEFGFARNVGRSGEFGVQALLDLARARKESLPEMQGGAVDWERMRYHRASIATANGATPTIEPNLSAEYQERLRVHARLLDGDLDAALGSWHGAPREPTTPLEKSLLADAAVQKRHPEARRYVELLRPISAVEADAALARLLAAEGKLDDAAVLLERALVAYRTDPWPDVRAMTHAIGAAEGLAAADPRLAARMLAALDAPFAVSLANERRLLARLAVGAMTTPPSPCAALLAPLEPSTPWVRELLAYRASCYAGLGDPRAPGARADLESFMRLASPPFGADLPPPTRAPAGTPTPTPPPTPTP